MQPILLRRMNGPPTHSSVDRFQTVRDGSTTLPPLLPTYYPFSPLLPRYVTSARTGSNVEAAFLDLVERAVAYMDAQETAAKAAARDSDIGSVSVWCGVVDVDWLDRTCGN